MSLHTLSVAELAASNASWNASLAARLKRSHASARREFFAGDASAMDNSTTWRIIEGLALLAMNIAINKFLKCSMVVGTISTSTE